MWCSILVALAGVACAMRPKSAEEPSLLEGRYERFEQLYRQYFKHYEKGTPRSMPGLQPHEIPLQFEFEVPKRMYVLNMTPELLLLRGGITPSSALQVTEVMWTNVYDKPGWDTDMELEYDVMPRDEFGVPAHIPPEISTTIRHTYYIPPQYYPFLKKLGDDTPELKPWMDKLINGEMTFDDYEEMFYQFAKPLKIHRPLIPMPYRTAEEMKKSEEVAWEGAWLSFRQRVIGDYLARHYLRDFLGGLGVGLFFAWVYIQAHRQYRIDMKLFYLEAPEHKINWVVPRGDL